MHKLMRTLFKALAYNFVRQPGGYIATVNFKYITGNTVSQIILSSLISYSKHAGHIFAKITANFIAMLSIQLYSPIQARVCDISFN